MERMVIITNERRHYYDGSAFVIARSAAKVYGELEALVVLDGMRDKDRRATTGTWIIYVK